MGTASVARSCDSEIWICFLGSTKELLGAEDRAVPAKERHSPFGCEIGGVISPEVVLLRLVDCVIAVGIMSHSEYPGSGLHVVRAQGRPAERSVRGVTLRLEDGDVLPRWPWAGRSPSSVASITYSASMVSSLPVDMSSSLTPRTRSPS